MNHHVNAQGSSPTASDLSNCLTQILSTRPADAGPDLAVRLICPDCKDPNPKIVEEFESGDLVCGDCGLVLGDRIVDTRSKCKLTFRVQDSP